MLYHGLSACMGDNSLALGLFFRTGGQTVVYLLIDSKIIHVPNSLFYHLNLDD